MNFQDILILGIALGGGIIFAMFSFFKNFFLPYGSRRDTQYVDHNNSGNGNLIFIFVFVIAIGLLVKYFTPQQIIIETPQKEQKKKSPSYQANAKTVKDTFDYEKRGLKIVHNNTEKKELVNISPKESLIDAIKFEELLRVSESRQIYSIQVGANAIESYAYDNAVKYIEEFNHPVYLLPDNDIQLTKILLGNFKNKTDAARYKKILERRFEKKFFIVEMEFINGNGPFPVD